ncbi:low molecular weight protein-tyrosine-phosphatase [Actinophytocola oryzae]|uniref:low molecular weight protein-tyrosine-phosphatase n=1 Tax=Actinophytocola oryzae TaxID=502181 RepID=UPI00312CADED
MVTAEQVAAGHHRLRGTNPLLTHGVRNTGRMVDAPSPADETAESLHVCFVCTGNICRSPIAALVFSAWLAREGLADRVRVTSAGTGPWHAGEAADPRARRVLAAHDYPTDHVAAQVCDDHLSADLVVALDGEHRAALRRLRVGDVRMLRSFDPDADGDDVADPYYDDYADFEEVLRQVEAAMPGMVEWVRTRI